MTRAPRRRTAYAVTLGRKASYALIAALLLLCGACWAQGFKSLVTQDVWLDSTQSAGIAMKTISQFLDQSKRPIYSVGPNATVREALELMAQHNIGAVLVLEGQTLAGIFSERDYARKVALKGKSSNETKVSDVMTAKVITIDTKHSIDQCMQIMTDNHIRHLPIVDDLQVMGLISIGDVVQEMIAYQKSMIEQLQRYISG